MPINHFVAADPESGGAKARLNQPSARQTFEIDVVDPTCDPSWDRLAASHPRFTFFHCSAWMRVLSKTYGHKPLALCCYRDGEIKVMLPLLEVASRLTGRRGVSLPFSDTCDPLFSHEVDPESVFRKLHSIAQERRWQRFEIRGRFASGFPQRPSTTFYGHSLDLRADENVLFARFSSPVRRAIRKAERSGMVVRISTSRQAVQAFYRIHVRTRRRHGLPPQPLSFFWNIHSEIIQPGTGFVVLGCKESDVVAGAIFFRMGYTAIFKFGASDERYQYLRPNNLVMWHAIRHLARGGVQSLHLGRTSRDNEGLRRFKLAWGGVQEPIEYFSFDMHTNEWKARPDTCSGLHNAVFSRLPLVINRLVGHVIYPHLD